MTIQTVRTTASHTLYTFLDIELHQTITTMRSQKMCEFINTIAAVTIYMILDSCNLRFGTKLISIPLFLFFHLDS